MALKHIILSLLRSGPMHGYRLRLAVRDTSWMHAATSINIYPSLHSLEHNGFVAHSSEVHAGRARKTYHILEAGSRELQRWLIMPTDEPANIRDQTALKIAMLNDSSSKEARAWIQTTLDDYRREIDRIKRTSVDNAEKLPFHDLTREYGLQIAQLRVKFLEDVLAADSG